MAVQDNLRWFPLRWPAANFWSTPNRRSVVCINDNVVVSWLTLGSTLGGHLDTKFSNLAGYRNTWIGYENFVAANLDYLSTLFSEEAAFDFADANFSVSLAWKGTGGLFAKGTIAGGFQYSAVAASDGSIAFLVKGTAGVVTLTAPAATFDPAVWCIAVFRHTPGANGMTIDLKRAGEVSWRSTVGTGAVAPIPAGSASFTVGVYNTGSPIEVSVYADALMQHLMVWPRRISDVERDAIEDFIGAAVAGGGGGSSSGGTMGAGIGIQ